MLPDEPSYIIAVGASAGSMDEITAFFDHTPLDGVAYVIIQHLSPDFKSRMVELLGRHSELSITEAKTGTEVKKNVVYLIPNNRYMTIQDGKLYLTEKEKVKGPQITIDRFFNSLAADYGEKAIGVILSGMGSDGTEGAIAIKSAGGMIIVRDPAATEFASMPTKAIASGSADFILEPSLMPLTIEKYVNAKGKLLQKDADEDKQVKAILKLVHEQSSQDFSEYKQNTILRRIKRRAAMHQFVNLKDYLAFLKSNNTETDALAKDFLISVTSFFRDKEAFTYIDENILPGILEKLLPGEELKLWVAGCATGEEAYSLAIMIDEHLTGKFKKVVTKIFATDIDTEALMRAGKGVYGAAIENSLSAERLARYFVKEGDQYTVKPDIRKMVIVARHDLIKNPPYCNMHLISCRNLLIYMSPVLQKKIFAMLLFGLRLDGYLFLGSSENPLPIMESLETVQKKWKIYKNCEPKRVARFDAFSLPVVQDIKPARELFSRKETTTTIDDNTLADLMNSKLTEKLGWLVLCIDEQNRVLKTFGDTAKYLEQKIFTLNLSELLSGSLLVAFITASATAVKENRDVTVNGIKIKKGTATVTISLTVTPLLVKKGLQKLRMITISEKNEPSVSPDKNIVFDEKTLIDQYTLNLAEELKDLKEELHFAYQQLDASNENIQSFNEEMISSNEEMQSTNEEMQSVNEELHTINADYQLKNKELLEMNDDLNNYFRSNPMGQFFVDKDLNLMKFSPGTVNQINLLPTDIGRPISNISTNIKLDTITADIKEVLKNGLVIHKEIETNNGKWYQVMTMPYILQADNSRNGAIVTFNEITELKHTQLDLDNKNQSLRRINADLDNFIYTASHDLLGPLANIEGSINIMNKMKTTNPESSQFLEVINSSIIKFRALITDIAMVGKIESDMLQTELVQLDELVDNIEWSLQDKMKGASAVITRNFEHPGVRFSKKNLRSILYNLISNAIKFRGPEAPKIDVQTLSDQDFWILSVADNGLGIPKNKIEFIFNMYGRLQKNIDGQGIGLYLAKKIVNAAGGRIEVESEPGKGSKFSIYLKKDEVQLTGE